MYSQRISANINNPTTSKCATTHCWRFCIVQETDTHFVTIAPHR